MKTLVRRYKYEICPSPIQRNWLAQIFGAIRFVYNECLKINNDLFEDKENTSGKKMSKSEAQTMLTIWRDGLEWMKKIPSQSLQVATHDLDVAYQNFFDGRAEKPRMKKRSNAQSFQIPQPKTRVVSGQKCIFVPNYKMWIPIRMHREFPVGAKIGAATITKTPAGRYFVSFVVTFESKEALCSRSTEMVGIDLNIKHIVLSTGEKIETPQSLVSLEKHKRRLQKSMQRKRDSQEKDKRESRSQNYEKNQSETGKIARENQKPKRKLSSQTSTQNLSREPSGGNGDAKCEGHAEKPEACKVNRVSVMGTLG